MRNKKTIIITSTIILLTILPGLFLWNKLPDPMAIHFDSAGNPNGYSSKLFGTVGLPLFLFFMHLVGAVVTGKDPKQKSISDKIYSLVLWIVPIIAVICQGIVLSANLGNSLDLARIMPILLGILFIAIGNYLPKCRQNYTVGIKIPWTLSNEENWNKTHRMAGPIWVVVGFAIIISALFLPGICNIIFPFGIIAAVLIPSVYSFWLHEKKGL